MRPGVASAELHRSTAAARGRQRVEEGRDAAAEAAQQAQQRRLLALQLRLRVARRRPAAGGGGGDEDLAQRGARGRVGAVAVGD